MRAEVRFQILSPGVIRLEYSPHRKFVDAPSVAVFDRHRLDVGCPLRVALKGRQDFKAVLGGPPDDHPFGDVLLHDLEP